MKLPDAEQPPAYQPRKIGPSSLINMPAEKPHASVTAAELELDEKTIKRQTAAREYLAGKHGDDSHALARAAEAHGVTAPAVRYWVNQMKPASQKTEKKRKPKSKDTEKNKKPKTGDEKERRQAAAREFLAGKHGNDSHALQKASDAHGVSAPAVRYWVKHYQE